ncbi:hypothetical protein [Sphingomonas sp. TREG-RG-20F-R18-01]|uniref:hypothetical protein n=1 Tax=Sphingomonas sp. TREG-RG-20F-R18-01 TaxID=2914982 RepID=UPI001F5A81D3|nr:hypothetical protein [Sphingomonas sp. TREG-RG-20F-R18-01]
MVQIVIGSVSHGTLRTADLLSAFASELGSIDIECAAEHGALVIAATERAELINDGADETEGDSDMVAELQDALDAAAPEGMYFGNTEGDGSDFGFWLNEEGRREALAREFSAAFEAKTRDNGDTFYCLRDGSPEWMSDAVHMAHGDMMPNDWSYRLTREVVDAIAWLPVGADFDDERGEIVDGIVPVYNNDRLQWLASSLDRAAYCDDAQRDGLVAEDATMFDRIAAGIYSEADAIYSAVSAAIVDAAE